MKKKLLFIVLTALASYKLSAQDSISINLNKAVELGLENSKSLKIANAKIKEESAKLSQTKFGQYPEVGISASHLRVNTPTIKTDIGGDTGEGGGTPDVNQVTYGMASASLPIFNGFQIRNSVKSAEYLKKASELDAENEKEEVVFNIISAYYNYYKLLSTKHVVEESLKQAHERVKIFSNQEKNGILTRNDLLKAELQQSNIELTLLDVNNSIAIANYDLNILLGIEEGTKLGIDTTNMAEVFTSINEATYYLNTAQEERSDLKSIQSQREAAETGVKIAKGTYYPSLALTAGYVNADIPGLVTITNAVNVGVGLKYSLTGLFEAKHKIQQAQSQSEQAYQMSEVKKDDIKKAVFADYANYNTNLKQLQTLKIATSQATENYRMTKNSYENSVSLLTDLLDAEVQKLQAQVNELNAKADAKISYYQLIKDTGLLNNEFITTK